MVRPEQIQAVGQPRPVAEPAVSQVIPTIELNLAPASTRRLALRPPCETAFRALKRHAAQDDEEAFEWADVAVSTCSEEVCPVTSGVRRISWVFDDPKNLPLERVRTIRDEIKEGVEQLVRELDAEAPDA